MAPFYPYNPSSTMLTTTAIFPSSTALHTPIETGGTPCPSHHNSTDRTHSGTHYLQPSSRTQPAQNTPTSLACEACETPILSDQSPPPPASTHTPMSGCDACEAPVLPDADGSLQPRNATLPGLSQEQVSALEGLGYHSTETGKVLMVVLLVAGAAVVLGAVWCVGRACWNCKGKKADKQREVDV